MAVRKSHKDYADEAFSLCTRRRGIELRDELDALFAACQQEYKQEIAALKMVINKVASGEVSVERLREGIERAKEKRNASR